MLSQMKKTVFSVLVVSIVTLCMIIFSLFAIKFSTIFYILICGALGVFAYLIARIGRGKEDANDLP
jgi:chromate transporter